MKEAIMDKFIKTNQNINEGIFGMGRSRPEDTGFDTAQSMGDVGSNIAGLASFLPGMRPKTSAILRGIAAAGNIGNAYADHAEGDTQDAMKRSALGLGWALGALSAGKAGKIGKVASTPLPPPPPRKAKLPPTEVVVRRVPRANQTQPRVIITPPTPITDPSRILSASPAMTRPDPFKQAGYSRMDDFEDRYIDPRIMSYVERISKRKGLPKFKKPSGIVVDTMGGKGTRLSRDLDIPAEFKVGGVKSRVMEPMTGDRYAEFAATHPGYAEALGRQGEVARQLGLDVMSDRRMKGAFPSIIPIVAGYEPDTVNNILVEAMQEYLKKKSNINEGWSDWVDTAQTVGDVASVSLGLIPGLNFVGSGIDYLSAGVDAAQGQYGDAAMRTAMGTLGLAPVVGAAGKGAARLGAKGLFAGGNLLAKRAATRGMGDALKRASAGVKEYGNRLAANQFVPFTAQNKLRVPKALGGSGTLTGAAARTPAVRSGVGNLASKAWKAGVVGKAFNTLMLGSLINDFTGNPVGKVYDWATGSKGDAASGGAGAKGMLHPSTEDLVNRSAIGPGGVAAGINQFDPSAQRDSGEKFRGRF